MEISESLLSKVRALLNKAERTDNVEEADAFNAKATELMTKYGIERAMLNVANGTVREVGKTTFRIDGSYLFAKSSLANSIARAFDCSACHSVRRDSDGKHILFIVFGSPDSLTAVEALYTSLLVQMSSQLTRLSGKTERNSFIYGYASGASAKLLRARKSTIADTPGAALVLYDDFRLANEKMLSEMNVRTVNTKRNIDADAYGSGRIAGSMADVGSAQIGPNNRKAIGR